MLSVKHDVKLLGLTTQALLAAVIAHSVMHDYGYDCVLTSCTDGTHGRQSLHYQGNAVDLRTRHIDERDLARIVEKIGLALGPEYDVVVEATHLHIEWQPKKES